MDDIFVIKNEYGVDVTCKVLATFELEDSINKYLAYTDYIYDKDMNTNVYFSEIVLDGDNFKLEKVDDKILKVLEEMYQEGVGGNNNDL